MRLRVLAAAVLAALAPLSILVATAPVVAAGPMPTPGRVKDVAIQSDGKVVVAFQTTSDRFTLLRLSLDGALDPTFGGDGIVETVTDTDHELDRPRHRPAARRPHHRRRPRDQGRATTASSRSCATARTDRSIRRSAATGR